MSCIEKSTDYSLNQFPNIAKIQEQGDRLS